jgi:hypothetical protein
LMTWQATSDRPDATLRDVRYSRNEGAECVSDDEVGKMYPAPTTTASRTRGTASWARSAPAPRNWAVVCRLSPRQRMSINLGNRGWHVWWMTWRGLVVQPGQLDPTSRVTRYDPISIWQIDMGDRYGRSDINGISIGISMWDMGYRFWIRYIDMVVYHIDMVILDIDMGYGLMIWKMTVSIWSSWRSIWDILSLCWWYSLVKLTPPRGTA